MSSASSAPVDFVVAVVAHRASLTDRLPSYLSILTENNFIISQQSTTLLSPQQSALLVSQPVDEADELFQPATPACLLLLSRPDAYNTLANLLPQLDHTYASASRWEAVRDRQLFFPAAAAMERALLVIKAGYSQDDYAVIMDELEAQRFVVIAKEGKILSADEATQLAGEDRDAVAQLTSDVSLFIAVERRDALAALTLLLGPVNPAHARRIAPSSLRARLSSSLYAPASALQVEADCRLVWPDGFALERTVIVVGGRAREAEAELEATLLDDGFTILVRQDEYINKQRAERLQRRSGPDVDSIATSWSNTPSLVLLATKPAAIQHARLLVSQLSDDVRPFVYASTDATVTADIRELFPLLPSVEPLSPAELLARFTQPTNASLSTASLQSVLTDALIALCKAKPAGDEAVVWLARYLLEHNPNQPLVDVPTVELPVAMVDRRVFVWAVEGVTTAAVDGLVKQGGYQVVDVSQLLSTAAASDQQYGATIGALQQSLRPIPAHITTTLIDRAITALEQSSTANRQPRYLLTRLPADLDTAFALEAQYGQVAAVLAGGSGGEVKGADGSAVVGSDVNALLEHYRVFGKVVEVDEEASGLQGTGPLRKLLTV